MSRTRALFVGVDAGDKDLLLRAARAGRLPTFARLLERGAWGLTRNPQGFYVGAVWPSFATGASPTRHKRYCFDQIRPGTYDTPRFAPGEMPVPQFWDELGRAGKRIAVLDVPKTVLSSAPNVAHVVDWTTHDPEEEGFRTWPPGLAAEILARHGADPVGVCDAVRRTASDFASLRDRLIARAGMKTAFALELLDRGGWDLFMTVFAEAHCAGHHFYHLQDPAHPRYEARLAAELGDPLLDVYRAVDEGLGRLLEAAGDVPTVVLASHGMGPHYEATFMLHLILEKLEARRPTRRSAYLGVRALWQKLVPAELRGRLFRRLRKKVKKDHSGKDFFQVPNNDVFGGIRVNLKGREPAGRVEPGAAYEELCRSLAEDLGALVNVRTGRPAVLAVHRTADLYPGEDTSHLPDLIVEWNREAPIECVESPKTGKVASAYRGCRTGDHKPEGLFVALGPGVRPGPVPLPVSVTDFAPTLAELAGGAFPAPDGRSLAPVLGLARRPL